MKVLGVDPGGTTGVALVNYDRGTRLATVESYDQLRGSYDFLVDSKKADLVRSNLVETWKPDKVVIENFIGGGPRTSDSDKTMKLVGFWIGVCLALQIPCVLQVPQQRKPFLPDAKQLIKKKSDKHAIDACSHALAFFFKEFPDAE